MFLIITILKILIKKLKIIFFGAIILPTCFDYQGSHLPGKCEFIFCWVGLLPPLKIFGTYFLTYCIIIGEFGGIWTRGEYWQN